MEFLKSQTALNLARSFAGESQARNRYTVYAEQARKEKQEYLARIFEQTADNEKIHAKEFLEMLQKSPLPPGKDTPEFQLALLSPTVQIFRRRPTLASPLRSIPSSELRFRGQARTVCCPSAVCRKDVPCTTPRFECIQDLHVRISAVSLDYPHQR